MVKVRERIWVGIDVGKASHHACAVDETGKVVFSQQVTNGQAAIEALIARAGKAGGEVSWALDMTSGTAGLLLALLWQTGQPVQYVPGRLVNRMAGAFSGEGKTDAKDAKTIAETARLRTDLVTVTAADPIVADLQVLTAQREDLMGDWVRGVNRLRALLASIFPSLERAFDYSTRSPLILLTGFQTPGLAARRRPDGVEAYLTEHGAWGKGIPAMVDKALDAAGEQTVVLPTEKVTAPLIARLAADLLDLDRRIKNLDKQLTDRFEEHGHAKAITSLPGFGPILGAQFLADTGGDLQPAFGTPGRLAAYAGLAPVPATLGGSKGNLHRPKRYHRGLRRVFYLAAFSSIRSRRTLKTFYQRKRARARSQPSPHRPRPPTHRCHLGLIRDNREFQPTVAVAA